MSEPTTNIPVPDLDNPLFAPFWRAAAESRLEIQCCADCGLQRWPPRHRCHGCGSLRVGWAERPARGTLFTWTTVGRATAKGHAETPYSVGIVELEGGPRIRMFGKLADVEPAELRVGMAMRGRFVPAGDQGQMTLIYWHPDR